MLIIDGAKIVVVILCFNVSIKNIFALLFGKTITIFSKAFRLSVII